MRTGRLPRCELIWPTICLGRYALQRAVRSGGIRWGLSDGDVWFERLRVRLLVSLSGLSRLRWGPQESRSGLQSEFGSKRSMVETSPVPLRIVSDSADLIQHVRFRDVE